jgi:2-dehydro-3-deoxygluconokinase
MMRHCRWIICGLLFFAATLNYIDRQVIGLLKPTLQSQLHWNEIDYGNIFFAFQLAYAAGLLVVGRVMDWLGTRKGFGLAVFLWSIAAMAHALARSVFGFAANVFRAWEGGGEYNVARGLKRCVGLDTAIATAFADNPVGRLVQDFIYRGGVDQSYVKGVAYDGLGRSVRNGLNFAERGFGLRAALGCSDRGNTAVSQLHPADFDWDKIFARDGARWFHTGGIFAALSETRPQVAKEAMEAARRHNVVVSYDLNYRESLWKGIGGKPRTQEIMRVKFSASSWERIKRVIATYPNIKVVATTLRNLKSATLNDWGGVLLRRQFLPGLHTGKPRDIRPRWRGRLVCLGTDLRVAERTGSAMGGGVWRRTWRVGHDHAR